MQEPCALSPHTRRLDLPLNPQLKAVQCRKPMENLELRVRQGGSLVDTTDHSPAEAELVYREFWLQK